MFRNESDNTKSKATLIARLDVYIANKELTNTVDKDFLAATALKEVVVSGCPVTWLDRYSYQYQQGELGSIYSGLRNLKLIKDATPEPLENGREYQRPRHR